MKIFCLFMLRYVKRDDNYDFDDDHSDGDYDNFDGDVIILSSKTIMMVISGNWSVDLATEELF